MTELFIADLETAFSVWIKLRMQHIRDGVRHARILLVETVMLKRAHELP
jgi:hypothetical protein